MDVWDQQMIDLGFGTGCEEVLLVLEIVFKGL